MNTKLFSGFLMGLSLMATHAMARPGADSSGGGDVLVFDDRVILADPYVKHDGIQAEEFHPLVKAELLRVEKMLLQYGADHNQSVNIDGKAVASDIRNTHSDFMTQSVFNPLVEYRFVTKIPDYESCKNRLPLDQLPPEARVEQVACTEGEFTWIREDLFKKLSIRDQAMLIVHERLRGRNVPMSNETIADITTGLNLSLSLLNSQLQGERPSLTEDQISNLQRLRKRMIQAKLTNPPLGGEAAYLKSHFITRRGGGLIASFAVKELAGKPMLVQQTDKNVSDRIYVGMLALYGGAVSENQQFELVATDVDSLRDDAQGVKIINSYFVAPDTGISVPPIGNGVEIVNSVLYRWKDSKIEDGAKIINSEIDHMVFDIQKGAQVLNTKLEGYRDQTVLDRKVRIGAGSILENADIKFMGYGQLNLNLKTGAALKNLSAFFVAESRGLAKYVGPMLPTHDIDVGAEVKLDFQNAKICGKANDFRLYNETDVNLASVDDLKQYCAK